MTRNVAGAGILIVVLTSLVHSQEKGQERPQDFAKLGRPGPESVARRIVQRLPEAQILDRIAYRTTIFAFPVFGFGVIFGAIWAEEAWGRYWGWDPKETVSFIAWVVYAAYLHARSTAGWRDRKAAWINVVGFVAMVFNLFFINTKMI